MGKKEEKFNDYDGFVEKFKPKKTPTTATRRRKCMTLCSSMCERSTISPTTCPSSAHSIPAETTRTTTTPRTAWWWTIHPSASSPRRSHLRALPESPHCINFLNPLMRVHVHTYIIIIYSKPYSCPFAPFVFPSLSYTSPQHYPSCASIPPPSLCS